MRSLNEPIVHLPARRITRSSRLDNNNNLDSLLAFTPPAHTEDAVTRARRALQPVLPALLQTEREPAIVNNADELTAGVLGRHLL